MPRSELPRHAPQPRLPVIRQDSQRFAKRCFFWCERPIAAWNAAVAPSPPPYLGDGIEPRPSRLAWCYGDPGVAAALLVAARAVGQADWGREALALALGAAELPPEQSGVVDAPLCHGAIGFGHVFNRLHQATGEGRLAEAARFWLERGLAMRRPGGKLGGFHALIHDDAGRLTRRVAFRGLLEGAAGIGLALLAATSDVEPAWDRVLMLN